MKTRTIFISFILLTISVVLASGCASMAQSLGIGEDAKNYRAAENLFEQGNYKDARAAYLLLAKKQHEPLLAEKSHYRAAYILVHYKNPDRNFEQAEREFEEFLARYPESGFSDEAGSWLDMIRISDVARTGALLQEISSLTKKAEEIGAKLLEAETENDGLASEVKALTDDKNGLLKKVGDLLNDKDDLLREKAALLKERDGLNREKEDLSKKIDALKKEIEALALAKDKLEKSLRDLRMVDVKMEKKRKKIK